MATLASGYVELMARAFWRSSSLRTESSGKNNDKEARNEKVRA